MVRKLQPTEASLAAALLRGSTPQPGFNWTEATLRAELETAMGWGYFEQNQIRAVVAFRELDSAFEITVLVTGAPSRGKGFMKRLLGSVLDAHSQKPFWLEVHEANKAAIQLYNSLNFQVSGQRSRYYPDGGAALLMNREPSPSTLIK